MGGRVVLLLPVCLEFYPRFLLRAGFYGGVSTIPNAFLSKLRFFTQLGFSQRQRVGGEGGHVERVHPVVLEGEAVEPAHPVVDACAPRGGPAGRQVLRGGDGGVVAPRGRHLGGGDGGGVADTRQVELECRSVASDSSGVLESAGGPRKPGKARLVRDVSLILA